MHGGAVSASSPGAGLGSTFVVRLPLVERRDELHNHRQSQIGLDGDARHRILVVDDNPDSALSLAILLRELGHEVDTAFDGLEGVEKAESLRPSLIFLDLGMPQMSGIDAATRVRALPHGNDITLVALTGWGQEDDRRRTREAGFDGHLLKPIDPAELARLLAAPPVRHVPDSAAARA
jgi:CheY-like chemotaxis protein